VIEANRLFSLVRQQSPLRRKGGKKNHYTLVATLYACYHPTNPSRHLALITAYAFSFSAPLV
jgi:hypothetical protein